MRVILINGSPRRSLSITKRLADSFLSGMHPDVSEEIALYDCHYSPCLADFACWFRTPGQCVQHDDVDEIFQQIDAADYVIWAMPLHVFGIPSRVSELLGRVLPRSGPAIITDELGRVTHPGFHDNTAPCKHVLIMSAAFPEIEGNFDAAVFQMRRIFGSTMPCITCPESSLFVYKRSDAYMAVTTQYLAAMEAAGREFARHGTLSQETLEGLNTCMIPREEYIAMTNGRVREQR